MPNMVAITVPAERFDEPVEVYAMRDGVVSWIGQDGERLEALEILNKESGDRDRYEHLEKVEVSLGEEVASQTILGYSIPSSDVCVRIGIIKSDGSRMSPLSLFPTMREPRKLAIPLPPARASQ